MYVCGVGFESKSHVNQIYYTFWLLLCAYVCIKPCCCFCPPPLPSKKKNIPRPVAGLSMLVEPKGKDSFKEIEKEIESDPIKKSVSKMTPGVAKVYTQD